MKIQKLNPSKLYYRKWPFKIECRIAGAGSINRQNLDLFGVPKHVDRTKLSAFAMAVKPFLSRKDLQIRTEGSHFNLFCRDMAVVEEIDTVLGQWIVKITGPTTQEELDFLLSNGHKKILCDTIPKDLYKYRIYFNSRFPEDKRWQFYKWCQHFDQKVCISTTSKAWLTGQRKWAQDPFMYVQDDKMLSMVGLQITGYVKRVEEFIERNSVLVT